jgi:hypothetical protein
MWAGSIGLLSAKELSFKSKNNKFNPIVGSWFEFQHQNKIEGKYWDNQLKNLTCNKWELKIKEMADIGLRYLVILDVAYKGMSFYSSKYLLKFNLNCKNPLELLLNAADKYGIKVFVSNGFFGNWRKPIRVMHSRDVRKLRMKAMAEIVESYGHHKSFYGWYFPNETGINGYYKEFYIDFVNKASAEVAKLMPQAKTLIAPYGTRTVKADAKFVKQLESLNVDYVAYQDEVGVRKSTPEETAGYFKKLSYLHKKAGRSKLWADIEMFTFEGKRYQSPLIPGPAERVVKQLKSAAPHVDNILIYEYNGLINNPDTKVYLGHPNNGSTELFSALVDNHFLS